MILDFKKEAEPKSILQVSFSTKRILAVSALTPYKILR
jgi:hypothetical protein